MFVIQIPTVFGSQPYIGGWRYLIISKLSGSIGPYGACLSDGSEYSGNYVDSLSREELKNWHLERIQRLAIRKVDIFAAETIPSVEEALAVLDAVDQVCVLKINKNLKTAEIV